MRKDMSARQAMCGRRGCRTRRDPDGAGWDADRPNPVRREARMGVRCSISPERRLGQPRTDQCLRMFTSVSRRPPGRRDAKSKTGFGAGESRGKSHGVDGELAINQARDNGPNRQVYAEKGAVVGYSRTALGVSRLWRRCANQGNALERKVVHYHADDAAISKECITPNTARSSAAAKARC